MRRSGVFFGIFIVLVGAVLLAINLGYVDNRAWGFFWPALLVLLGVWFIMRPRMRRGTLATEQSSFPLNAASEAEISIHYGAGRMQIRASANPNELAGGTFVGGVLADQTMQGSKAVLSLRTPSEGVWAGPWPEGDRGYEWQLGINAQIPLDLNLHTGANEELLDLSGTQVRNLVVDTGASKTDITLPAAAGYTRASVKFGVASVNIVVPQGVAASIQVNAGLSGVKIDEMRFPQTGGRYESPDYATATHKAEIVVTSGLGSIEIN